jgi:hypothetical protein
MNLTEMDDADAKRLVDFAAGLSFGLRGSIERVTNKVFLLSPQDVDVTAEDKARSARAGSRPGRGLTQDRPAPRGALGRARTVALFWNILSSVLLVFLVLLFARFVVDWVMVLARSWRPSGWCERVCEVVYATTTRRSRPSGR